MALIDKLKAIADAIRGKTGKTEEMTLDQMPLEIASIVSGGGGGDTTMEDGLVTRTSTEYTNDRVTTIGGYAFYNNTALTSVSFPNVTTFVGSNNFQGCSALRSIHFPKLEFVGSGNSFRGCTSLTEAVLPSLLASLPSFYGCVTLRKVDVTLVGAFPSISANVFNGATMLNTIIIRADKVVTLGNLNAFTSTPFASGGTGGTVYVPSALIESYKTETNWSTLYTAGTCKFVAIEGSEYE